jgi:hypothetical protein
VLVFGGVHVGTQLVGRRPEGFLDVVEHFSVVVWGKPGL